MTIAGVPIADFAPETLLAVVFLLVLTDKLVWHKRLTKRDERIQTLEATVAALTEQNGIMLKSAIPTVDGVLSALHERANEVSP